MTPEEQVAEYVRQSQKRLIEAGIRDMYRRLFLTEPGEDVIAKFTAHLAGGVADGRQDCP